MMLKISGLCKTAAYLNDTRQKLLTDQLSATDKLVHCVNHLAAVQKEIYTNIIIIILLNPWKNPKVSQKLANGLTINPGRNKTVVQQNGIEMKQQN